MRVSELWRYPVKSLRGESLEEARITELGIENDRLVHARRAGRPRLHRAHPSRDARAPGRPRRGRRADDRRRPLGRPGGARGRPRRHRARRRARLLRRRRARSASTSCRSRSRPTAASPRSASTAAASARTSTSTASPGLTERDWVGREVRIGDAMLGVRQVRGRCVMTTFDPDTLEQDITVLQKIYWELGGRTALDCYVLPPGPGTRRRRGRGRGLLDAAPNGCRILRLTETDSVNVHAAFTVRSPNRCPPAALSVRSVAVTPANRSAPTRRNDEAGQSAGPDPCRLRRGRPGGERCDGRRRKEEQQDASSTRSGCGATCPTRTCRRDRRAEPDRRHEQPGSRVHASTTATSRPATAPPGSTTPTTCDDALYARRSATSTR